MGPLSLRLRPQSSRAALVSSIGLELADEQLNLVQLQAADPPLIKACASLRYPVARAELRRSVPAFKSFIRQALGSAPFAGRKVVAALPVADVRILSVTYQIKPNETDDQAVAKLMEERIGEDLAQFIIDYVLVRGDSAGGDRRAIVMLSERTTVIGYLDLLRKAGLDVVALEVSPVAIRRLVATLIAADEIPQNVLVVDTGERKSHLTMVSGQRLLFDEEIDFGEAVLLEQIGLALDVPHDVARGIVFRHGVHPDDTVKMLPVGLEDTRSTNTVLTIARPHFVKLVTEIRRAMLFASSETRGSAVGHLLLTGGIARWPGADALLRSLAELPVTIPQPLGFASNSGRHDELHPELVVAAGLALRGFSTRA